MGFESFLSCSDVALKDTQEGVLLPKQSVCSIIVTNSIMAIPLVETIIWQRRTI
jgi:hypothetical protein